MVNETNQCHCFFENQTITNIWIQNIIPIDCHSYSFLCIYSKYKYMPMVQGTHHCGHQTHHRFGLPSETPGQPLVARQIDKAIEIAREGAGEATCHMASKMTCRVSRVVFLICW